MQMNRRWPCKTIRRPVIGKASLSPFSFIPPLNHLLSDHPLTFHLVDEELYYLQ